MNLILAAGISATVTLTAVAAIGVLMKRAACRHARHARKTMAARQAPRRRLDGSHEACELTTDEWGWSEFIARRHRSLGKGVLR